MKQKQELTDEQRLKLENALADFIFPDDLDEMYRPDIEYYEQMEKAFDRALDTIKVQQSVIESLRSQLHTLQHLNSTLMGVKEPLVNATNFNNDCL